MSLFRTFSVIMVIAVGVFGIQYHLLPSLYARSELDLQQQQLGLQQNQIDLVGAALQRIRLEPRLAASVDPGLLQELASQLGRQLVQLLPECVPSPASARSSQSSVPKLYIITPTYRRPEQLPEMTRLSQTLLHVPNIKWLVIEDAQKPTPEIAELLKRTGIDYEHLIAPMPDKYKTKKGNKPRGVSNRNRGIAWIRANATDGVVYFADDDNTYDIRIFDQMRFTKRLSMWPVGLLTKFGLSSPVVKDGKFKGFYDGWVAGRKFPVDMAEFAISVNFLLQRPNATMPYKPGFEEDGFLKSLAPFEPHEIELLADNCSKILVWHTQSKKNQVSAPLNETLYKDTNLIELKKHMV